MMKLEDAREIGETRRSKAGRKLIQPRIDRAITNLMNGNRWDAGEVD